MECHPYNPVSLLHWPKVRLILWCIPCASLGRGSRGGVNLSLCPQPACSLPGVESLICVLETTGHLTRQDESSYAEQVLGL